MPPIISNPWQIHWWQPYASQGFWFSFFSAIVFIKFFFMLGEVRKNYSTGRKMIFNPMIKIIFIILQYPNNIITDDFNSLLWNILSNFNKYVHMSTLYFTFAPFKINNNNQQLSFFFILAFGKWFKIVFVKTHFTK
jgi:hypothetical protein